jgi:pyruvate dehydrogenase E2 component (dihydrolipoamide acetyltransferase)
MPTNFTLPELGENIAAGDVVRVLVSPGDAVKKDQPILELETDKATIEVPSSVAGTVKEIKVKPGQKVKVGEVVLTVDDGGGATASAAPKEKEQAAEKPKPQPVGAPEDGGLSQQLPEAGAAGAPDRTEAPAAEARPKRGEVVDIRGASRAAAPAQPPPPGPEPTPEGPAAPAAPSVRRLARELGVEIKSVTGSGPAGRISADDVQAFVRNVMAGGGGGGTASAVALPDFT